jgi:uncharacterized cupredoxin-like copper-binding protein
MVTSPGNDPVQDAPPAQQAMIDTLAISLAAAAFALGSTGVLAHGEEAHAVAPPHAAARAAPHAASANGHAGKPAKVSRTVKVSMRDDMRFVPSDLTVRKGETVRFVLRNDGKVLHEMVLGTEADLRRHAELMRAAPDMAHAEANMAHVEPGAQGELVWTFDRAGEFAFACLVPGHFEAGMKGKVVVK